MARTRALAPSIWTPIRGEADRQSRSHTQRLALGVLLQAIRDAKRGDLSAHEFLTSEGVALWARLAGLNVSRVQRRCARFVASLARPERAA